jgi:hypothetical protein
MPSESFKEVMRRWLDQAPALPVSRRIKLYRGLAEFCGDPKDRQSFLQIASELEGAERHCREFVFLLSERIGSNDS